MKTLKYCLIGLVSLTVFFAVQDMTVESVLRGSVDKGWGMLNVLFGGSFTASSPSRQLPQNQGDSEEFVKPIDELEVIE